jgi:hypothetical protein
MEIYILRSYEERLASESYEGPKAEAEAWAWFCEFSDEYRVYRLDADGTWADLTKQWVRDYCREFPTLRSA